MWRGAFLYTIALQLHYIQGRADPASSQQGTDSLELGKYSIQLEQIQFCSPLISIYNAKFYLIYFFNIRVPQALFFFPPF